MVTKEELTQLFPKTPITKVMVRYDRTWDRWEETHEKDSEGRGKWVFLNPKDINKISRPFGLLNLQPDDEMWFESTHTMVAKGVYRIDITEHLPAIAALHVVDKIGTTAVTLQDYIRKHKPDLALIKFKVLRCPKFGSPICLISNK